MMVLVFTTCLVAAPQDCRTREMPIFEQIAPMTCLIGAPGELARWRETHPDWRIARWRCEGVRDEMRASSD